MSGRFSPAAARLAGLAAQALGWRPDEFWAATPAELALSLSPGAGEGLAGDPPSRSEMMAMMERETAHVRSD